MNATQPSIPSSNFPVKVLIVDDRAQVRYDLRLLLELSGKVAVVGEAENGLEALQLAAAFHPDVVLLDLELNGLDGMDGCQVSRLVKSRHLAPRIVFLSIFAGPEDMQRAFQAGADDYIQKGSPFEELLNTIFT
jgi:DNA-binding NarL/FixJ family response regulator